MTQSEYNWGSTILVHNFFYRTAYAQSILIRAQLAIALIVIILVLSLSSYPLCPFSSLSWVLIGSLRPVVLHWWHSLILSSMEKRSTKYSLLMMVRNAKRSMSRSVMEGLAQGLFCHIFGISTMYIQYVLFGRADQNWSVRPYPWQQCEGSLVVWAWKGKGGSARSRWSRLTERKRDWKRDWNRPGI